MAGDGVQRQLLHAFFPERPADRDEEAEEQRIGERFAEGVPGESRLTEFAYEQLHFAALEKARVIGEPHKRRQRGYRSPKLLNACQKLQGKPDDQKGVFFYVVDRMQGARVDKDNVVGFQCVGDKIHRHLVAVAHADQDFRVGMPVAHVKEVGVDPLGYIDAFSAAEGEIFVIAIFSQSKFRYEVSNKVCFYIYPKGG